jgi:hypothetical protein
MTASKHDDLVYVISRMRCIHVIDTHTGFTLYSQQLFDHNSLVFVSCLSESSGMMCVTRLLGEVYQIQIKHDQVFEYAMCRDDLLEYAPQVSSVSSQPLAHHLLVC